MSIVWLGVPEKSKAGKKRPEERLIIIRLFFRRPTFRRGVRLTGVCVSSFWWLYYFVFLQLDPLLYAIDSLGTTKRGTKHRE